MNRTPFAIALMFALVGAGLLYLYKQRLESETAGGRRIPVLMARRGINLGARITQQDIGVRYLPEAYTDARNVRSSETQTVIGVRAGNEVRPNEAILWTDLATNAAQGRKLSGLVRPSMRGVAVPFALAFGGLLRPGDRVDVLLTVQNPTSQLHQTVAFEQNVLVLAVDNDLGVEGGRPRSASRGSLATLAVTPEQGQRLTLAQREGYLSLLLRNPEDLRTIEDLPETRSADLLAAIRARFPPPSYTSTPPTEESPPSDASPTLPAARKDVRPWPRVPLAPGRSGTRTP
jgi:pilus assembly protein CpaB